MVAAEALLHPPCLSASASASASASTPGPSVTLAQPSTHHHHQQQHHQQQWQPTLVFTSRRPGQRRQNRSALRMLSMYIYIFIYACILHNNTLLPPLCIESLNPRSLLLSLPFPSCTVPPFAHTYSKIPPHNAGHGAGGGGLRVGGAAGVACVSGVQSPGEGVMGGKGGWGGEGRRGKEREGEGRRGKEREGEDRVCA